ncbi:MAG TPA: DUF3306 domain-containing protein [Casimicrobiaceae bacterium]
MIDDPHDTTRFSLRRWSQRKLAAARTEDPARRQNPARPQNDAARDLAAEPAMCAVDRPAPAAGGDVPAAAGSPPRVATRDAMATTPAQPAGPALPPLESLTIDSDFAPFLQPGVDESLKRGALRKLFRDPRFNVMDGLDVYIDDYSKPSPMEPELARTLVQARYLFDPPKTRVNALGHVEDVPAEPVADKPRPAPPAAAGPALASAPRQADAAAPPGTGAAAPSATQAGPGDAAPPPTSPRIP